jgi:hypothetical protein
VLFGTPPATAPQPASSRPSSTPPVALWQQGTLADKVYSALTATGTAHGGHESTLLALGNVFYHWGGIIVPPATPTPSSSRQAIPTAPPTWPPMAHPTTWPWERPVTRPGAPSTPRPHSRPAAPPNPGQPRQDTVAATARHVCRGRAAAAHMTDMATAPEPQPVHARYQPPDMHGTPTGLVRHRPQGSTMHHLALSTEAQQQRTANSRSMQP